MCHVQREAALVGADVQRLATCVLCGGRVVQPLVEKGSGLLPGSGIVSKAQAVELEGGLQDRMGRVSRVQRRQRRRLQPFEGRNARVTALNDGFGRDLLGQHARQQFAHVGPVEPANQHLHQHKRPVAIDDEAGQLVGFAEDEAAGFGLHRGAQGDGAPQPGLDEG